MTTADLLGSRNRMEDIDVEHLEKSDLKAVLVKVYDHNRLVDELFEFHLCVITFTSFFNLSFISPYLLSYHVKSF